MQKLSFIVLKQTSYCLCLASKLSLTNRMLLLCHVTPCSEAVKDWLLYYWYFVPLIVILCDCHNYGIQVIWIRVRKYPVQKW